MNKLTHVKWAAFGIPVIRVARNDARLYLTKTELVDLKQEITEFLEYYSSDFSAENIEKSAIGEKYDIDEDIDWTKTF